MFDKRVLFLMEGHHKFWKSFFSYFSIYCLYKNEFTYNFSKFNLFPSLFLLLFFFFFTIWTKYSTYVPIFGASQMTVMVKNTCQCWRYKKTQVWSLGEEHPLQEGTAAYSSILAWPILWTEEPVQLQSVGLPIVGHNWSDLECMHAPIFNHLIFCLLGRVGEKMDSQKWRMKKTSE